MPFELLLIDQYNLILKEYHEAPPKPNEIRAAALLSAISHGTEISLYRGSSPFHGASFDRNLRLFIDTAERENYPISLGYEWVGRVVEVGDEVTGFKIGDLVHLPLPHRQTQTWAPAALKDQGIAAPLPGNIQAERAVFLAATSIALQAIHDARIKPGDHVIVFGLGVLGLLTVQLARLNGAQWIDAVDLIPGRRELALSFGANRCFDPTTTDIGLQLKRAGPGADVAIEFSGSYAALQQAIRCVRMAGLVVAAGFYQGAAEALRLGKEWLHNRITMVASSRGWGNPHRDYPLWDRARLRATALALIQDGHVNLDGLITHRFRFSQSPQAYQLIDQAPEDALKVVLEY